jgi:hypothetical protein
MISQNRDKVGKISVDLAQKTPDTRDPIEQMRENLSDYDKEMWVCIERGKKELFCDFYIVVITKKEPLMENVLRNYFGFRRSCPTPDYDQAVYKYSQKDDEVSFLWVVPSKDACMMMIANRLIIDPEERELKEFVLRFASGDLMRLAKLLNGELDG